MFVKYHNGGYLNTDHINGVYVEASGSEFVIMASFTGSDPDVALSGSWSTQAEAEDAMRRLFRGVDPATY